MKKKIVIVGAGSVGFYLAKTLAEMGNDISIIDIDPEKVLRAKQELDALVIEGNGAQSNTLEDAQVESADLFLAVTRIDEINIIASMKANKMNPDAKILARVRSGDYQKKDALLDLADLGIEKVINPEQIAAREIQHLVQHATAQEIMTYNHGRVYMVALTPTDTCELMHKSLRELGATYTELPFRTVAIDRDGETIIPGGDHIFQPGDKIFIVCLKDKLKEMYRLCGFKQKKMIKTVLIMGAGKLGRLVAANLKDQFNVRLVDHRKEKLLKAAKELPDVLLLHADGLDVDFLESEGISEFDALITLTDDETTNLFAGLIAKKKGVDKVIVHINSPDYLPLVKGLGINSVVSKNLSTVDAFMRYVVRGQVHSVMMLEGIDTEVIELSPSPNSKIIGVPLEQIDFPPDAVVGGIIKGGYEEIAMGRSIIEKGDRAIVFARASRVNDVEALFN
ncbi:MAG: Trk system potassium transporter TrkA [Candidatus Marinimicrobia bacterium]|jgi:trk system potassium uptake protein|nr:Trk system potassium transporter TrkA [Candidatus Neomarinimicrobiota bacterium]MBT4361493.1 Trk system potassium transporter TrkA [Candidatus Neomarinimicrobiota bacterium]MBT4713931.1 Trk system potassium transporter TrkA [Candidatus Neomarinimicrobiota bacterium]MBT4946470.1 Trk system potassium transporter TrkA [Candidatus Neomarinimicrobiota bacterium]MBT5269538.1 Trk system potassium transporter TrkA [Candidatus Neomarinimicrobiota bacterium]